MEEAEKVRIDVTFATRKRFKAAAAQNGLTYDAFLIQLLDQWDQQNN